MFFLIEFSCNLICRPPPGRRERSSTILPNHTAADRTGGSQVQLQAQPDLFPQAEHPTVPDYIQAEVFLETLGFFTPSSRGSALHVMLFLENISQALFIFNGLRSHHCQRALLGYHYHRVRSDAYSRALTVSGTSPGLAPRRWGRALQASDRGAMSRCNSSRWRS
jgi:hypothetical protein